MKANRKFIVDDEDAVSPVIAVILMVAITVVLAATVYVWVSGFGANSSAPANSIAVTSGGQITQDVANKYWKNYTVAAASPGMKYEDFEVHVAGAKLTWVETNCNPTTDEDWSACSNAARAGSALVAAGDTITIRSASSLSGSTLNFVDANANSIILTLTIS